MRSCHNLWIFKHFFFFSFSSAVLFNKYISHWLIKKEQVGGTNFWNWLKTWKILIEVKQGGLLLFFFSNLSSFMERFIVFILLFQVFLIAYGGEVEADHEIQRNFQEQQPYRTAYHFQPPKNWMNGLSFLFLFQIFVSNFSFVISRLY